MSASSSRTFCLAPWVHTFAGPSGARRLCCLSDDCPGEKGTFEEHWNGPYLKDVRRRMLAGARVEACHPCEDLLQPYRDHFNFRFQEREAYALAMTGADGTYRGPPVSVDYRVTHLCNFRCLICGPVYSTSWESEARRTWGEGALPAWLAGERATTERFQREVLPQELLRFVESGQISEIYWAGGEPLLNPVHWAVMKALVDTNQARRIAVRYNTNLSHIEFQGLSLTQLLPQFGTFDVGASLDADGALGEYLRHGLEWERWVRNFDALLRITGPKNVLCIEHRLTLPGILALESLARFARDRRVHLRSKMADCDLTAERISPLHPRCLPKRLLTPLVLETMTRVEAVDAQYSSWVLDLLRKLLEAPDIEAELGPEVHRRAVAAGLADMARLDLHRHGERRFCRWFEGTPDVHRFLTSLMEP